MWDPVLLQETLMADKHRELVARMDALLIANPNLPLDELAQELGVAEAMIERAVREVRSLSFREYSEDKRLEHALLTLIDDGKLKKTPQREMHRACLRFVIPRATVCYAVHGPEGLDKAWSKNYPLVDVSKKGMSFLTDHPLIPGRRVSLLIYFSRKQDALRLEGSVVFGRVSCRATYRYLAGIQFKPFAALTGCNDPQALGVLEELEQTYGSRNIPKGHP